MAKNKIIVASLVVCIFSLFCGICSFAADDNSINLGNTVTETMDKAGRSMENVKNEIFSDNMNDNAGKTVENGINHVENGVNHVQNGTRAVDNAVVNTTRLDNNSRTGNYSVTRTQADTRLTNSEGMRTTTWMWIVLAASAVIIISAIWYYATQNNGKD